LRLVHESVVLRSSHNSKIKLTSAHRISSITLNIPNNFNKTRTRVHAFPYLSFIQ